MEHTGIMVRTIDGETHSMVVDQHPDTRMAHVRLFEHENWSILHFGRTDDETLGWRELAAFPVRSVIGW
jgi:hypothetical protein